MPRLRAPDLRLAAVAASLLLAPACDIQAPLHDQPPVAAPDEGLGPTPTLEDLREILAEGEAVDLLIELTPIAARGLPRLAPGAVAPTHDVPSWKAAAAVFVASHKDAGLRLKHLYEPFPMLLVEVDSAATMDRLQADPRVRAVFPDAEVTLHDTEAETVIGRRNGGGLLHATQIGAGTSIAVLDTGLEFTHPDFGSCTANTLNTAGCKVAAVADISPEDGSLDDHSGKHGTNVAAIALSVAPGAKVIGLDVFTNGGASGTSSDVIKAIAWAVQNRATYNIVALNMSLGDNTVAFSACPGSAYSSGIAAAKNAGIAAIAASGNGAHVNGFSAPACEPDVISVGATYDQGYPQNLNYGPCADNNPLADRITCFSNGGPHLTLLAPGAFITGGGVTSQGTSQASPHVAGAFAVLKAQRPEDSVTTIRDRMVTTGVEVTDVRANVQPPGRKHRRLDLGAAIMAGGCDYTVTPVQSTVSHDGGSFAVAVDTDEGCAWTPHEAAPWLTVATATSPMVGPGSFTVTVSRQTLGSSERQATITIGAATFLVTQEFDPALLVPPEANFLINASGNTSAATTTSLTVTLSFIASPSEVKSFCVKSTSPPCTPEEFQTFTGAPMQWTLPSGLAGPRTVYATFRDARENEAPRTREIVWDGLGPTGGRLTVSKREKTQITLAATAPSDYSGVEARVLRYKIGSTTAPICGDAPIEGVTDVNWPMTGDAMVPTYVHSGLTENQPVAYTFCARDGLDNWSAGSSIAVVPSGDVTAPRITAATVNGGAKSTNLLAVKINATVTDASSAFGFDACIKSTKAACEPEEWVPLAADMPHTLLAGLSGNRPIYLRVRDRALNISGIRPLRIMYDVIEPSVGRLKLTPGDAQVTLGFSAWRDRHSGLAGYKVVWALNTPPATCNDGTLLTGAVIPSASRYIHTGLTNLDMMAYRVCAVDKAGNVTSGSVTGVIEVKPDTKGPVSAFTLAGQHAASGITYIKKPSGAYGTVVINSAPVDASAVTQMCVSLSTTCTNWESYQASTAWSVPISTGPFKVYVTYRDQWNNTGTTVAKSGFVDGAAPTVGAMGWAKSGSTITITPKSVSDNGGSGVKRLKTVFLIGSAPASDCSDGTVLADSKTGVGAHTVSSGNTYIYRTCGEDNVGNLGSSGTLTLNVL